MYTEAPFEEITLDEFELMALDRLQVLRKIEDLKVRVCCTRSGIKVDTGCESRNRSTGWRCSFSRKKNRAPEFFSVGAYRCTGFTRLCTGETSK